MKSGVWIGFTSLRRFCVHDLFLTAIVGLAFLSLMDGTGANIVPAALLINNHYRLEQTE